MIELDFSAFNLKGMEKALEDHVRKVTNSYGTRIYNHIVTSDFPYWSGAYINSWLVGFGRFDSSFVEAPEDWEDSVGTYSRPTTITHILDDSDPAYKPIYIYNASPHAHIVEFQGTKTSDNVPWKVAYSAFNSIAKTPFTFY
jgi:hypothetical protein